MNANNSTQASIILLYHVVSLQQITNMCIHMQKNDIRIETIDPSSPSCAWTHWAASLGGISRAAPACTGQLSRLQSQTSNQMETEATEKT